MFIGELACLFVFKLSQLFSKVTKKKKDSEDVSPIQDDTSLLKSDGSGILSDEKPKPYVNPLIFLIPALCDLGGTTLLNVGLIYTYASVYQMLRGIVVVFNAIFSVIFLKAKLFYHHWIGVVLILIGLTIVGLSSVLYGSQEHVAKSPILGAILVVAAQVLAATQFVVEEKFLAKYEVPALQCVGWEGFWGLSGTIIILFVVYYIPGSDYHSLENAPYATAQCFKSIWLASAVLGSILSIAFFNYFGVSITKRISSTTRAVIDSCRTAIVWLVSLVITWESFKWLQLLGFIILVTGTFLYTEVLKVPYYHKWYLSKKKEWESKKNEAKIDSETGIIDE